MRFRLLPLLLIAPLLICSAYYLTIGYYWGNSLDSDEAKGILFIAAVLVFFFIKHWLLTFWMFLLGLLLTVLLLLVYRMYKPKKGNPRPRNQVRRSPIQPDERIDSFKELL